MLAEIDPMATLARRLPRQGVGVEVGVHTGGFSRLLLRLAQPSRLHLVDP